jgi:ATP-dependent Lon protease
VTKRLKIIPVKWIDEVLELALERPLPPRKPDRPAKRQRAAARTAVSQTRTRSRTAVKH